MQVMAFNKMIALALQFMAQQSSFSQGELQAFQLDDPLQKWLEFGVTRSSLTAQDLSAFLVDVASAQFKFNEPFKIEAPQIDDYSSSVSFRDYFEKICDDSGIVKPSHVDQNTSVKDALKFDKINVKFPTDLQDLTPAISAQIVVPSDLLLVHLVELIHSFGAYGGSQSSRSLDLKGSIRACFPSSFLTSAKQDEDLLIDAAVFLLSQMDCYGFRPKPDLGFYSFADDDLRSFVPSVYEFIGLIARVLGLRLRSLTSLVNLLDQSKRVVQAGTHNLTFDRFFSSRKIPGVYSRYADVEFSAVDKRLRPDGEHESYRAVRVRRMADNSLDEAVRSGRFHESQGFAIDVAVGLDQIKETIGISRIQLNAVEGVVMYSTVDAKNAHVESRVQRGFRGFTGSAIARTDFYLCRHFEKGQTSDPSSYWICEENGGRHLELRKSEYESLFLKLSQVAIDTVKRNRERL